MVAQREPAIWVELPAAREETCVTTTDTVVSALKQNECTAPLTHWLI